MCVVASFYSRPGPVQPASRPGMETSPRPPGSKTHLKTLILFLLVFLSFLLFPSILYFLRFSDVKGQTCCSCSCALVLTPRERSGENRRRRMKRRKTFHQIGRAPLGGAGNADIWRYFFVSLNIRKVFSVSGDKSR